MLQVYLNGIWYPEDKAKISVYDHGFLYGDGLFETMRAYNGKIFLLKEHFNRLTRSAKALKLKLPFNLEEFECILYTGLKKNNLQNARLRVTVSRGYGRAGLDINLCPTPTVVVMISEFCGYPEHMYKQGISAQIVNTLRISQKALNPAIKSLNFLNNIMAKEEASVYEAADAIMLNQQGDLTEATTSNLFFIKYNIVMTPAASCGLLPGITRRFVITLARCEQFEVVEGRFLPEELLNADEAFLTNTGFEIMPLTRINGQTVGEGVPGIITQKLHKLFRDKIKWLLS